MSQRRDTHSVEELVQAEEDAFALVRSWDLVGEDIGDVVYIFEGSKFKQLRFWGYLNWRIQHWHMISHVRSSFLSFVQ
jgi:hypothetical protein